MRGRRRPKQQAEDDSHARIIRDPVSLLPFCQWLADTHGSIALHESLYMYPLVESVHVLTLCLFVGMAVMLDLRLLGMTLRGVPISQIKRPARCRGWSPASS